MLRYISNLSAIFQQPWNYKPLQQVYVKHLFKMHHPCQKLTKFCQLLRWAYIWHSDRNNKCILTQEYIPCDHQKTVTIIVNVCSAVPTNLLTASLITISMINVSLMDYWCFAYDEISETTVKRVWWMYVTHMLYTIYHVLFVNTACGFKGLLAWVSFLTLIKRLGIKRQYKCICH